MSKKKFLNSLRLHLADTSLPDEEIDDIVESVSKENPASPWWVIFLKVLAYAIGLILAGYSSASAATLWIL